jgi:uncharacterized membrane protein (TIGR02234 family)
MTAVGRLTFAAALLGLIIGGALALFASGRSWQTVTAHRARPLADDVLDVTGRTLHPAVSGFAVVALAGVVGILASRGIARRIIGAVLVIAGGIVCWDAVTALRAISSEHARSVLRDAQSGVGLDAGRAVTVAVHPVWPVLAALGGLLIVLAGALTIGCGSAWTGLSGRYEHPAPAAGPQHDARLWSALDRGIDPTADPAPGAGGTADAPERAADQVRDQSVDAPDGPASDSSTRTEP